MSKQPKSARIAIIGETLQVLESKNPALKGLRGPVVDETRNTIKIRTKDGTKTIIKDQVLITINEQKIDGKKLLGRIPERIKQ